MAEQAAVTGGLRLQHWLRRINTLEPIKTWSTIIHCEYANINSVTQCYSAGMLGTLG